MTCGPTAAWREDVFSKPECFDVESCGTTTTRYPVFMERKKRLVYAWGGYERVAMLLLEHLWREQLVARWKSQPFDIAHLGGRKGIPDFLVELDCGELHVIQVRAKRFLTEEVQQKYRLECEFLEPLGFRYNVWTNKDVLSSKTSHTVAELDRGRMFPAPAATLEAIRQAALSATRLGELFDRFGWDDVMSAAAHLCFHIDITEPIHEHTAISRPHSAARYRRLFEAGDVAQAWWEALNMPAEV